MTRRRRRRKTKANYRLIIPLVRCVPFGIDRTNRIKTEGAQETFGHQTWCVCCHGNSWILLSDVGKWNWLTLSVNVLCIPASGGQLWFIFSFTSLQMHKQAWMSDVMANSSSRLRLFVKVFYGQYLYLCKIYIFPFWRLRRLFGNRFKKGSSFNVGQKLDFSRRKMEW